MHTIGVSDSALVASPARVRVWAVVLGAIAGLGLHALLQGPWHGVTGLGQAAAAGALLLAAAEADLRTGRIPNTLTLWAGIVALATLTVSPAPVLFAGLAGSFMAGGLLLGIRATGDLAFGRPGMGMGDVKLAAVLGFLLGPEVVWALYLAVVLGGLVAGAALLTRGRDRSRTIPFAPFIAAGTIAASHLIPFAVVWTHLLGL